MYWMDNLLVTPVLGINYKTNLRTAFKYKEDIITSIINTNGDNEFDIKLNKENPIAILLFKKDGFNIQIDQQNTFVSYKYPILQKRKAGMLPIIETSKIEKYTQLLEEAKKHLKYFWSIINQNEIIKIKRIGMMAICNIEKSAIPPGLELLIEHCNKPWNEKIDAIDGSIVANIRKGDGYYEKCHHIIKYKTIEDENKTQESEVIFNLDYQRYYNELCEIQNNKIEENINEFVKVSLEYFEKFGQGDLNYE